VADDDAEAIGRCGVDRRADDMRETVVVERRRAEIAVGGRRAVRQRFGEYVLYYRCCTFILILMLLAIVKYRLSMT